jgi:histone acetyltransferase (RNA polymerase elongator complex component)
MAVKSDLIIPIFLPHVGCLHRCVFCNQHAITGVTRRLPRPSEIGETLNTYLGHSKCTRRPAQLAFYGGNFLGLSSAEIRYLLDLTRQIVLQGRVQGIRFSTRPDTVTAETLDRLKDFPVAAVELGVQSMDDHVLKLSRRGHSSSDTTAAIGLLKQRSHRVGAQIMVGLPGDTAVNTMRSAERIAELGPDFVRIYPTVVLEGSPLAGWYRQGKYRPMSLGDAVSLVKRLYLLFEAHQIPVIRMGLQASADFDDRTILLDGPYHPAFGHLVHSEIFLDRATASLEKYASRTHAITLQVHPRSVSKMRGLSNANIVTLKKRFSLQHVTVIANPQLQDHELIIEG